MCVCVITLCCPYNWTSFVVAHPLCCFCDSVCLSVCLSTHLFSQASKDEKVITLLPDRWISRVNTHCHGYVDVSPSNKDQWKEGGSWNMESLWIKVKPVNTDLQSVNPRVLNFNQCNESPFDLGIQSTSFLQTLQTVPF